MLLRRLASNYSVTPTTYRLPPTIQQLLSGTATLESGPAKATVSGWVKSIRKHKNVSFGVITDGSSSKGLQAVFVNSGEGDALKRLTNGAAVQLTGQLVKSRGPGQSHELLIDESADGRVEILGESDPETYPIQKHDHSTEYLRNHVHLRARTSKTASMVRIRNQLGRRIGDWFEDQGFCYVHTPVITGNDAEASGEAFRIASMESGNTTHPPISTSLPKPEEFFSRPAFLTVSHQLHLEALATSLSRVYTLSPCFRAERSQTGRHLAEFWMLEAEWAFLTGHDVNDVCSFVEGCLRNIVGGLTKDTWSEDLQELWKDGDLRKRDALQSAFSINQPWTRISYTDAVKELQIQHKVAAFDFVPQWGRAIQSEHERWIAENLVNGPVFITDYPTSLKPFYMRANDDGKTVGCFDLIVPFVGELAGGSIREERPVVLRGKMRDAGLDMNPEDADGSYSWYEELRRWGGAPHAGFGMGFERLVGWVGGIPNVRECVPMPRWTGKMSL
ncbi:hypothetical protein BDQ17DRAFT_1300040 [Cyathus striatus]|nr:hypothetical protein BDQ17DRAFT_1300040 [Cyathus striatus]